MTSPTYSAAPAAAATVEAFLTRHAAEAAAQGERALAPLPDAEAVAEMLDAAFWASLRREEGRTPRISLAFVPPDAAGDALRFEYPLPLAPDALTRLAPAVERPGVHLGVWRGVDELHVWGSTRHLPSLCLVLEVVEPGLLVVKYRRAEEYGKFGNVAVIRGNRIEVVDEASASLPDCPDLLASLLGFESAASLVGARGELVQLAISMRGHGRGGSLLVVPAGSEEWRESIARPVLYSVSPPFARLAEQVRMPDEERDAHPEWHEQTRRLVDSIAGLTAVDGAAIMTDRYDVLAFGAKIGRREGYAPVEQVAVTEPVIGNVPAVVAPSRLGGTRHLSAAQFVHDQRGSLALVASQDGRFTIFAWSPCEQMVHAHRIEALLL